MKRDFRAEARKLILSKKPYDDPKNQNQVKNKSGKKTLFDLVLDKCKSFINYIYPSYKKQSEEFIIFEEEVHNYNNRAGEFREAFNGASANDSIKLTEENYSNPLPIEKKKNEINITNKLVKDKQKKENVQTGKRESSLQSNLKRKKEQG